LASSVREDGSGVATDADVVASLATAVSVDTIRSISINIEINTCIREVTGPKSGPRVKVGKDAEGLDVVGAGRGLHATSEELDRRADVVTSSESVDEGAHDLAEEARICRSGVHRRIKEVRGARVVAGRKVRSCKVSEHATDVPFLSDGDGTISCTSEGEASVGSAGRVEGEGAVASSEERDEVVAILNGGAADEAIVDMHSNSARESRVSRMTLDKDAGFRESRKEATSLERVAEVGVEDVVGLTKAVQGLKDLDPLASQGVGDVRRKAHDNLVWAVVIREGILKKGADDIEVGDEEGLRTAASGTVGMIGCEHEKLTVVGSSGSEGVDIRSGRLAVTSSSHAGRELVRDRRVGSELWLDEELGADADGIRLDVGRGDATDGAILVEEFVQFDVERNFDKFRVQGFGFGERKFFREGGRGRAQSELRVLGELSGNEGRDCTHGGVSSDWSSEPAVVTGDWDTAGPSRSTGGGIRRRRRGGRIVLESGQIRGGKRRRS
jgi:hypothetical protein